jgi:hypothetical protein
MTSRSLFEVTKRRSLGHLIDVLIASRTMAVSRRHYAQRNHRMAIFANDLVGISINQFGFYERDELDVLFEFLSPLAALFRNGTAFDIGANIGNHSVYFSKRFKLIHSFEPNPHAFQLLTLNSKRLNKVVTHNIGLGDFKGTFDLLENPTNVGGSPIIISHYSTGTSLKSLLTGWTTLMLTQQSCAS